VTPRSPNPQNGAKIKHITQSVRSRSGQFLCASTAAASHIPRAILQGVIGFLLPFYIPILFNQSIDFHSHQGSSHEKYYCFIRTCCVYKFYRVFRGFCPRSPVQIRGKSNHRRSLDNTELHREK